VVLAAIRSAAVLGIEAYDVTVEVDVAAGLPAWTIVGLASSAVKEARERVTAAIANSGFALPSRRVTVNLSPADVRKDGTAFDLPIALGLLVATGQLERRPWRGCSWRENLDSMDPSGPSGARSRSRAPPHAAACVRS
jgi:magnesium chelatase family protein